MKTANTLPTVNEAIQSGLAFLATEKAAASCWIEFTSAISGAMTCKLTRSGEMLHVQKLVDGIDYEAYEN